jgi:hypothetical protein
MQRPRSAAACPHRRPRRRPPLRLAEETLRIKRVAQDTTDPIGRSFVLHFNRNLTRNECETVPAFLSLQFLPTEVNGPDTVIVREARTESVLDPEVRKKVKAAVAGAGAQAEKNLALEHKAEWQAAVQADEARRRLEAIDWDDDSESESPD